MELKTIPELGWKNIIPPAGTITKTPSENYIITNGVGGGGTGPTDPKPPKPVQADDTPSSTYERDFYTPRTPPEGPGRPGNSDGGWA